MTLTVNRIIDNKILFPKTDSFGKYCLFFVFERMYARSSRMNPTH